VAAPPARPGGPAASLAIPAYRLLLAGFVLTQFATNAQQVANLLQVYQLTHSALDLGLTGLFQALPLLGFGMFGGALADALDRRMLIIASQAVRLVVVAALALVTQFGVVEVWHVYASTLVFTAFGLFDRPARTAIIPNVVPRPLLFNAVALQTAGNQFGRIVGPAVAGGMVAAFGLGATYWLIALSGLLVVGFMLAMRSVDQKPVGFSAMTVTSMAVDGMKFLLAKPAIMGLIVLDGAVNFFAAFRAVAPVFADQVLHVGPEGVGLLLGAPGVGAMIGSLFITGLGDVPWKGKLVTATTCLFGLCAMPLGYSPWFPLSVLVTGVMGFCDAIGATVRQTTVQVLTPDALRGRVSSAHQVFSMGGPSLGYVQIGIVASVVGAQAALAIGGALCCATVVAVAWWWRATNASFDLPDPEDHE